MLAVRLFGMTIGGAGMDMEVSDVGECRMGIEEG